MAQRKNAAPKERATGIVRALCMMLLDCLIYLASAGYLLIAHQQLYWADLSVAWLFFGVSLLIVLAVRVWMGVYRQVWRFGGSDSYLLIIFSDAFAVLAYYFVQKLFFPNPVYFALIFAYGAIPLLMSLSLRIAYSFIFKRYQQGGRLAKFYAFILKLCGSYPGDLSRQSRILVAVYGTNSMAVALADSLRTSVHDKYFPLFFIDGDKQKIGKIIHGIRVIAPEDATGDFLRTYSIRDVILADPELGSEEQEKMFVAYQNQGITVRLYDADTLSSPDEKKPLVLKEVKAEEMLFRQPVLMLNDAEGKYYKGKTVLITGAGGSIGSELCRQLAKMQPKRLVLLDICENGIYDIQQDLKMDYGTQLDVKTVIVSICNRDGLEQVFKTYHPDIVLHAAAHKHVPLMEENPVEAVANNVFGTRNLASLSAEYGVRHFIMISTDKAVNPTNVMGATKRLCEKIVFAYGTQAPDSIFSATRFGNVLGSAGSVVPLFKKQIARGGPVTITDKRIIRYFMTIPEAAQLVLDAGSMAQAEELFVLDMGQPVSILSMAEKLITYSGKRPYIDIDIVETGLRPGEKLYEELLCRPEEMTKTQNKLIFVEKENPDDLASLTEGLDRLWEAVLSENPEKVVAQLKELVPTFKNPDEVNRAADLEKMKKG